MILHTVMASPYNTHCKVGRFGIELTGKAHLYAFQRLREDSNEDYLSCSKLDSCDAYLMTQSFVSEMDKALKKQHSAVKTLFELTRDDGCKISMIVIEEIHDALCRSCEHIRPIK